LLTRCLLLQSFSWARIRSTSAQLICKLIIATALASFLGVTANAQTRAQAPLDLAGKTKVANPLAHAQFIFFDDDDDPDVVASNPSWDDAVKRASVPGEFTLREIVQDLSRKDRTFVDGTYLLGPFWAKLTLINSSDQPLRWRIDAREAGGPTIRAFAINEGASRLILDNRWVEQLIEQRVPLDRLVASRIIEVAPQGAVQIWIDAEYGMPFKTGLRLVEEEQFDADRQSDLASLVFILGVRFALFLALLAFGFVLRDRTAFAYAAFHSGLMLASLSDWGFDNYYLGLSELASGVANRLLWALTFISVP